MRATYRLSKKKIMNEEVMQRRRTPKITNIKKLFI